MANLKPVFSSESTALSTTLNSLADSTGVSSSEITNASNRYLDARIDIEMAAAAANTGYVAIYVQEGDATGKLGTTTNLPNMRYVDSFQLNGTTTVRKSFFVQNISQFWGVHVYNNSGGALASSANTVKWTGLNYENV